MQPNVTFFLSCPTGKQAAHTNTICTHTAVSRSHTNTAISQRYTHTAVSQSRTHTAASRQLYTLHNLAISSSSSRAYKSGLCRFHQFCKHLKLTALPASKHTVALFAADLSRSVAPRTARVYLAAVSLLHRRAGLRTPAQHNPSSNWPCMGWLTTIPHNNHLSANLSPPASLTHS